MFYPVFTCSFLHLEHRSHITWKSASSSLFYEQKNVHLPIKIQGSDSPEKSFSWYGLVMHRGTPHVDHPISYRSTCFIFYPHMPAQSYSTMHPLESCQYCKAAIKYVISYRRTAASRKEYGEVGKWTVEWKPGRVFRVSVVIVTAKSAGAVMKSG